MDEESGTIEVRGLSLEDLRNHLASANLTLECIRTNESHSIPKVPSPDERVRQFVSQLAWRGFGEEEPLVEQPLVEPRTAFVHTIDESIDFDIKSGDEVVASGNHFSSSHADSVSYCQISGIAAHADALSTIRTLLTQLEEANESQERSVSNTHRKWRQSLRQLLRRLLRPV